MATIEEVLLTDISHVVSGGIVVAADGDVDQVSGLENIRQALFRRLMVSPGTLVHRPDYGVGIKDYLNAVNSIANQRSLALRIRDQFEQDDRVRSFEGMRVSFDDTRPERVTIFVRVVIDGFEEVELGFVPFGETV